MSKRLDPATEGPQYLTEEPSRLQFAAECRREGGTVYAIAGRLRRDPRGLQAMARNMAVAGVLVASPAQKGQRSVIHYSFNREWSAVLDACLTIVEPGSLTAGAEVLLVSTDALDELARLLAGTTAHRTVIWMAELQDSAFAALLVVRPEQATRLLLALQSAGRVARSAVKCVLAGEELTQWAENAVLPFAEQVSELEA